MLKSLRAALVAFVLLTVITGVIYPLIITVVGQAAFPQQANGSLITRNGQVVGSALIGQSTDDPRYFWSRPSAISYAQAAAPGALTASAATNFGWTNATLAGQIAERQAAIRAANNLSAETAIPADLVFASASGLDPHISPEAAAVQSARVAQARTIEKARVDELIARFTESPQFGVLGQPRVNVLLLNLALDDLQ